MTARIKFLGAAQTVTGSKYLLQNDTSSVLVDGGLFQGPRDIRQRNWSSFRESAGIDAGQLDAVLLTHAHLDHAGFLPKLAREGLKASVYCTAPTAALCKILLLDSAKIQEEDAEYRARKGLSRHKPPLPLYTEKDAQKLLKNLKEVPYSAPIRVSDKCTAEWSRSGHILGACSIGVEFAGKRIVFSGDVGRYDIPILQDPVPVEFRDLLVVESTYGNRTHSHHSVPDQFEKVINQTVKRNGVLIIPSFAVGRTQFLLYHLRELKEQKRIPDLPVFVDSPMATDATSVYVNHPECYDEEARQIFATGKYPFQCSKLHFVRNQQDSKKLNAIADPMIIIAASGMIQGGRVVHHVYHRISSPLNTILFVGYQAEGTKGGEIQHGAKSVRLLKQEVDVRAHIETLQGVSAHGDRNELLRWIRESADKYGQKPAKIAVTHGSPESARDFAELLRQEFEAETVVPSHLQNLNL